MKIVHITASYKPAYIYGGPIQSVGKLCEVLAGAGKLTEEQFCHNRSFDYAQYTGILVEVLSTTANGKYELDVETGRQQIVDGVPVTYFKRRTKDHSHFSPELLYALRRMLQQARHDKVKLIIHIHAWWNLVSVLSCLVAKWYNVPVVLSPRGMLTSYTQHNRNSIAKKLIHNLIGKRLLKYCHIHATGEQEKEDVLKIIKPKSITVIPNLVKLGYQAASSIYRVSSGTDQERDGIFKMIFLSRIEEKKGLELLFEALANVNFSWTLTIAGSGTDEYLKSLKIKAERLKLNHLIQWTGQISNENKFNLLAEHDLCVLTSYNENFANIVIESLSAGTAVLLSDKVGLAGYVADKGFGWVTTLHIEGISRKLTGASEDKLRRDLIRATAPQQIREDFDDEVLVLKYLDLYKEALRADAD